MRMSQRFLSAATALALMATAGTAVAQRKHGPGVTDTEIKLGQTLPYSGPVSAFAVKGKAEVAYFKMLNEQGGINGRKVNLISLDDGYSPPKTVELVRKLVEEEQVLAIFDILGTAGNVAVQRYLNNRKVPQLFSGTASSKFNDPKGAPWSMAWFPNGVTEGKEAARFILKEKPNARIAILTPNDDLGKDVLRGIREGLGDRAKTMIVAEKTYETTDPTVDNQVIALAGSGADVFLNMAVAKFATQAIRKANESGWKPFQYLTNVSASIAGVIVPAGAERAVGVYTSAYMKDPNDPVLQQTKEFKEYHAFVKRYYPDGDPYDMNVAVGYSIAQTMEHVLRQCGDDLSRENLMRQATNLKNLQMPMVIDGLLINTSPTDFAPLEELRMRRFDGKSWVALAN